MPAHKGTQDWDVYEALPMPSESALTGALFVVGEIPNHLTVGVPAGEA